MMGDSVYAARDSSRPVSFFNNCIEVTKLSAYCSDEELIAHSPADIARMAQALEIACSALKAIREAAFEGDYDRCDLEAEVAEKRIEALGRD